MNDTVEETRGAPSPWMDEAKRIGLVLLLALVGALTGGFVASQQPARYESTARLLVGPIGGDGTTLDAAGLLSQTYADLVASRTLVSRVAEELAVAVDDDDVRADGDQQSRVITVTVTHESALTAQVMADALAGELTEVVQGASSDTGVPPGADDAAQLRVLDEAGEAERVERATLFLVGGGAVVGAGLALLLLRTGSLRREPKVDPLELAGAPVLEIGTGRPDARVDVDDWDLLAAQLRHALAAEGPYSTVAFVPLSDDPELDSIFLQLIASEARAGRPVVATDAASNRVEPPADTGVVIAGTGTGDPLVAHRVIPYRTDDERDVPAPGGVLLVGSAVGDDTESGTMRRLRHVIDHLRNQHEYVLATWCPPPSSSSVPISAAAVVDRLVFVARSRRVRPGDLRRLREQFASVGAHPAAVIEVGDAAAAVEVMLRLDDDVHEPRYVPASLPPRAAAELAQWLSADDDGTDDGGEAGARDRLHDDADDGTDRDDDEELRPADPPLLDVDEDTDEDDAVDTEDEGDAVDADGQDPAGVGDTDDVGDDEDDVPNVGHRLLAGDGAFNAGRDEPDAAVDVAEDDDEADVADVGEESDSDGGIDELLPEEVDEPVVPALEDVLTGDGDEPIADDGGDSPADSASGSDVDRS